MPLGPFDEYLAHQTSDTFDHVATSDRNFYDRYYFNMHSSSDELFVITGLGQYPNLGVTDAFITVSIGTEQHTVRASRELGSDRMDTAVGPLSVEVVEGLMKLRIRCDENEWGVSADLTFTGVGRRARGAAHVHPPLRARHPGRHPLRAGRHVGGHDHGRRAARSTSRPTAGRACATARGASARSVSPSTRASRSAARRTATGSATTGCRCSSTTTCSRSRSTRTPTATAWSRSRCGCGTSTRTARSRSSVAPRSTIDYLSGTREMRGATVTVPDPDGKPITVTNTPLRTLYLAAGSGYVNVDGKWGHGVYQGPLKVEGLVHDLSDPEERRSYAGPQRDAVPVRARHRRGRLRHAREHARRRLPTRPASSRPTVAPLTLSPGAGRVREAARR